MFEAQLTEAGPINSLQAHVFTRELQRRLTCCIPSMLDYVATSNNHRVRLYL